MSYETPVDRTCSECHEVFSTSKEKQIYCSYQCYYEASKKKTGAYQKLLRKAGIKEISKICKWCEDEFSTTSSRKLYCSHACYHEACLDKNRIYMENKRKEWREKNPAQKRTKPCALCNLKEVATRSKYCEECRKIARQINISGYGFEMPQQQQGGSDVE